MSFIPSDLPLRWFVGKQNMISRKQVSMSAKSPTHSPSLTLLPSWEGGFQAQSNPILKRVFCSVAPRYPTPLRER